MKIKNEAFDKLKEYKAIVEIQKGKRIKVLCTGRGGEYFPNFFSLYCEENGIIHQRTALDSPQQNGLALIKNRTLTNMVNSILLNSKLSLNLWGKGLYNRLPHSK